MHKDFFIRIFPMRRRYEVKLFGLKKIYDVPEPKNAVQMC